MGVITGLLAFFGIGLAGPIILVVAYYRARSRSAMLFWGGVAAFAMILQCLVIGWFAGIGSATGGGQNAYGVLSGVACFFVICLGLYFSGINERIKK